MVGNQFTGKTSTCQMLKDQFDYVIVDMKTIQDGIRKRLSTEDEPYEGEIKIVEVENEALNFINEQRASAEGRIKFVFDGTVHSDGDEFAKFIKKIGMP